MIKWKLRQAAQGKGWKQLDLAKYANIRIETISNYYTGKAVSVKIQHLNDLCTALECSLSDILEYVPDKAE